MDLYADGRSQYGVFREDSVELEQRLLRLEKSCRRWRRSASACAVLLVAIVAMGQAGPQAEVSSFKTIHAEKVVAKEIEAGAEGAGQILMGTMEDSGGPHVVLLDKRGATRVSLLAGKVVALMLHDEKMVPRAVLGSETHVKVALGGSEEIVTPIESLRLYGPERKAVFSAPE